MNNKKLMENNGIYQISVLDKSVRKTFVIIAWNGMEAIAKAMKYGTSPQIHGRRIPVAEYWK